jgi:hypothetical protein
MLTTMGKTKCQMTSDMGIKNYLQEDARDCGAMLSMRLNSVPSLDLASLYLLAS